MCTESVARGDKPDRHDWLRYCRQWFSFSRLFCETKAYDRSKSSEKIRYTVVVVQRELKVGGGRALWADCPPAWLKRLLVASYSRMKSAWVWANGGQPILVCYIRKYVIILGGYSRWRPPNQNIGGCVPGGVDACGYRSLAILELRLWRTIVKRFTWQSRSVQLDSLRLCCAHSCDKSHVWHRS